MERIDTDRIVAAILTASMCSGKGLDIHLNTFDTRGQQAQGSRGSADGSTEKRGRAYP